MADDRSGTRPPPGWYPDPAGSSASRFWDGSRWTDALSGSDGDLPPVPDRPAVSPDLPPVPPRAIPPTEAMLAAPPSGAELPPIPPHGAGLAAPTPRSADNFFATFRGWRGW